MSNGPESGMVLEVMVPMSCVAYHVGETAYVRCPACNKGFLPLSEGAFHLLANCKGSRHFKTEEAIIAFLDGAPHR